MEYLPTLGLFKITLGVNVGKYSIHGSSGLNVVSFPITVTRLRYEDLDHTKSAIRVSLKNQR